MEEEEQGDSDGSGSCQGVPGLASGGQEGRQYDGAQ